MKNGVGEVSTQFFELSPKYLPFRLKKQASLEKLRLAYETYGHLNEKKDNALLLFHALTGSQHAAGWNPSVKGVGRLWNKECQRGWWDAFIGPSRVLDTNRYFIICANYLGGCYGSTGPLSECEERSGKPYAASFPEITFSDIVDSQVALLDHLEIETLHAVLGASIGGMMSLILATRYPWRVKNVILIASDAKVSLLQRILNLEQIRAIEDDQNFQAGYYDDDKGPDSGMAFARMISHKTFVSLTAMHRRACRSVRVSDENNFKWYKAQTPLESYLLHQGAKFPKRFDANSYLRILNAWQKFDLLEETGVSDNIALLKRCQHQCFLVFSIDSDVCFYPEDQKQMVDQLREASVPTTWITVNSEKGHDSFLLEPDLYGPHIWHLLKTKEGGCSGYF